MTTNMGSTDKTIRVVVGVAILGLGLYLKSWWGLVGLLPLITGLVGYCPAYRLLGISTCPKKP
ncbi:MAG: DUF2892 domain-containing protein [Thermoanaerobaculum sp.]|nr:DUF2892 domain-containing protein [Thermoanaerobaculum sp.]